MGFKKLVSVFYSLLVTLSCLGQATLITGTISDFKTNEPLPLATVFINSTTISTASQVNGQYSLKNIPAGEIEIVVRYIGYETSRTKITVHEGDRLLLNIKMLPASTELPGIQIKADRDKEWEKKYRRFEKVFLGENLMGARILNAGVVDLEEVSKGKVLIAKASEPIEIENPGLGYKVFYYLQKFQCDNESYSIGGDMRFEELKDSDPKKVERWVQNRKNTYSGSLRHLLVALINHRTAEEGFQLYVDLPGSNPNTRTAIFSANKGIVPFTPDSVVFPGNKTGEFKIQFKQRVEVHYVNRIASTRTYRDIPYLVGWITPERGFAEVSANGLVMNFGLSTSGYLSEARIAGLLPNDYKP
jgi:hypothetical protein